MTKASIKKVVEKAEALDRDALDKLSDQEIEALAAELNIEPETVDEEVKETDVDGTSGTEGYYKTNQLSVAMKSLAGMDNDQIAFFLKSLEQIGREADGVSSGAAAKNADSIKMKGSPDSISSMHESLKASLKEDLSTVFGDSKELSEEFKEKITTLFEAAVSYRVTAVEQLLIEQYENALEEEVSQLADGLIAKVDEYVSYVAEEWVKDNEVAIQKTLDTEIATDFIADLKALFDKHYITIPPEKVDVAESLAAKLEETEEALNKALEENMQLSESVKESERDTLITEFTTGMTLSQTEKFKQLIEAIDYDGDDEAFVKKMDIVRKSHFKDTKGKTPSSNIITEEITYSADEKPEPEEITNDPTMRQYVNALSRTIRH